MKATPMVWTGRILSGLFVIFMLAASVAPKFFMPDIANASLENIGWPTRYLLLIGVIELVGVLLYVYPKTSLTGAVLLTGLLGGAMASNLRAEMPVFSFTLFSLYLALFMWGGLWLRDPALRALFPWRK